MVAADLNFQYAAIIDCGSSASRIFLYKWLKSDLHLANEKTDDTFEEMQLIAIDKADESYKKASKPEIVDYLDKLDQLGDVHLKPLFDFAIEKIPKHAHHETKIFFSATGGMRLLDPNKRKLILNAACEFVKLNTPFKSATCTDFKVLSGEEEGLFGWIAANYLLGKLEKNADSSSVGFLELGGASLQIAFKPDSQSKKSENSYTVLRLRTMGGLNLEFELVIYSWLGLGVNEAFRNHLKALLLNLPIKTQQVDDPCLPLGYSESTPQYSLVGKGDYQACLKNVQELLNKSSGAESYLMNNVNLSQHHFIGTAQFWKIADKFFSLGPSYDFEKFKLKAESFCDQTWDKMLASFDNRKAEYSEFEISRICFRFAWMITILHQKLKFPKKIEINKLTKRKDENILSLTDVEYSPLIFAKGVNGYQLTWTLGQLIIHLSNETTPKTAVSNNKYLPVGYGTRDTSFFDTFDFRESSNTFDTIVIISVIILLIGVMLITKANKLVCDKYFIFKKFRTLGKDSYDYALHLISSFKGKFMYKSVRTSSVELENYICQTRPSSKISSMHDLQIRSRNSSPSRGYK